MARNKYYNSTKKGKAFLMLLLVLLLTNILSAQTLSFSQIPNKENAIKNLAIGIKSDNYGLQRSCIYYAGKYEITDLVQVLVDQLEVEQKFETRRLIALVLYKIGDKAGLDTIKKYARKDDNARMRNLCAAITVADTNNDIVE